MGIAVNTFNNGEVIINEGDVGKSIFRLVEGNADVIADYGKKEPFRLGILRAGDYFGEMAIFEECPRSATVVAASTTVRVLEIPEDRELVNIICDLAVKFSDDEISKLSWTDFVVSIPVEEYPELVTYLMERRLYVNDPVENAEEV